MSLYLSLAIQIVCGILAIISSAKAGVLANRCEAIVSKNYGVLYIASPKSRALKRAKKLLEKKLYLEAAWLLEEAGEIQKAQEIKTEIETVMLTGSMKSLRKLHGFRYTEIVELPDGITGIFKFEEDPPFRSYKYEVAAYLVSKLLGIDLVPVTVEREFNGKKGSLQYFVVGKHPKGINKLNWGQVGLFLEFLIGNYDFVPGNVLVLDNKRPVLIDHNAGFHGGRFVPLDMFTKVFMDGIDWVDLNPGKETLMKLKNLNESDFKKQIGSYIDESQLAELMKRRQLLLDKLSGFLFSP